MNNNEINKKENKTNIEKIKHYEKLLLINKNPFYKEVIKEELQKEYKKLVLYKEL